MISVKEVINSKGSLGFETLIHSSGSSCEEVILCLHSLGLDGKSFSGLASLLGTNRAIYSFDQRAHGAANGAIPNAFSDFVADASIVIDSIGADTIHLVGHSMGGAVAALLAAQNSKVASLTIIASPPSGLPAFANRAVARRSGMEFVIGETLQRWFGSSLIDEQAENSISKMTPEGFDASWIAFSQFKGYDKLAKALPPTLCIAFEDDLSTPPESLAQIALKINGIGGEAAHVTLSNAGHMGLLTHPHNVSSELQSFLNNLPKQNQALSEVARG